MKLQIFGRKFRVDYSFYPDTLNTLKLELLKFPKQYSKAKRIHIIMSKTKNVNIETMVEFLRSTQLQASFENEDWEQIIHDSWIEDPTIAQLDFSK